VSDLHQLLDVLALRPTGAQTYEGSNLHLSGGRTVFGGQILAQAVVAAAAIDASKDVRSLHTIFARGAAIDQPLEIAVDVLQAGRSFASASVTFRQGDKDCARSLVLLSSREPDLIRHQPAPPPVVPPGDAAALQHGPDFWEVRMESGVDLNDPDAIGPAELTAWARFPGAPDDQSTTRALLAYASDGFLIATAMRPHTGVGQSLAHVTISTTVVTHTLSFHEDVNAADWLTFHMQSPNASHGCSYGRGEVFGSDGLHVASFVQDNMIRDFPPGKAPVAVTTSAA
jgi:acyl-CoA thioesterase II